MRRYGTTPGKPEEYRSKGQQAVTPKDAATLIIVKQGDQPRLLLGKRAMTHKFMPGKFVFPGGRLDYVDQRLRVPVEIQVPVMERLRRHTQARTSDAKLRGLALAAVRETFEETGFMASTGEGMQLDTVTSAAIHLLTLPADATIDLLEIRSRH